MCNRVRSAVKGHRCTLPAANIETRARVKRSNGENEVRGRKSTPQNKPKPWAHAQTRTVERRS